jgi:hypothetical protein
MPFLKSGVGYCFLLNKLDFKNLLTQVSDSER